MTYFILESTDTVTKTYIFNSRTAVKTMAGICVKES